MMSDKELKDLLVGRRIISVDKAKETLTLDDGTILEVECNVGGCSCGSGDYYLTHLESFDSVITNVEIREDCGEFDDVGDVHMFVFSDSDVGKEVITAEGYDNGWYGYGFWLNVRKV